MAPARLEICYRRLLRWFPAGHRALHQEEMLGVLMAGADPGRNRPSLAESADLLLGAARIRLRPGRALSDGPGWRDALAVYSIAAPLLMLISTLIGWLAAELELPHIGLGGFPIDLGWFPAASAAIMCWRQRWTAPPALNWRWRNRSASTAPS